VKTASAITRGFISATTSPVRLREAEARTDVFAMSVR
jgi:hypothetical protein